MWADLGQRDKRPVSRNEAWYTVGGVGRDETRLGQPLGALQGASTQNDRQNFPRSISLRFGFLRTPFRLHTPVSPTGRGTDALFL